MEKKGESRLTRLARLFVAIEAVKPSVAKTEDEREAEDESVLMRKKQLRDSANYEIASGEFTKEEVAVVRGHIRRLEDLVGQQVLADEGVKNETKWMNDRVTALITESKTFARAVATATAKGSENVMVDQTSRVLVKGTKNRKTVTKKVQLYTPRFKALLATKLREGIAQLNDKADLAQKTAMQQALVDLIVDVGRRELDDADVPTENRPASDVKEEKTQRDEDPLEVSPEAEVWYAQYIDDTTDAYGPEPLPSYRSERLLVETLKLSRRVAAYTTETGFGVRQKRAIGEFAEFAADRKDAKDVKSEATDPSDYGAQWEELDERWERLFATDHDMVELKVEEKTLTVGSKEQKANATKQQQREKVLWQTRPEEMTALDSVAKYMAYRQWHHAFRSWFRLPVKVAEFVEAATQHQQDKELKLMETLIRHSASLARADDEPDLIVKSQIYLDVQAVTDYLRPRAADVMQLAKLAEGISKEFVDDLKFTLPGWEDAYRRRENRTDFTKKFDSKWTPHWTDLPRMRSAYRALIPHSVRFFLHLHGLERDSDGKLADFVGASEDRQFKEMDFGLVYDETARWNYAFLADGYRRRQHDEGRGGICRAGRAGEDVEVCRHVELLQGAEDKYDAQWFAPQHRLDRPELQADIDKTLLHLSSIAFIPAEDENKGKKPTVVVRIDEEQKWRVGALRTDAQLQADLKTLVAEMQLKLKDPKTGKGTINEAIAALSKKKQTSFDAKGAAGPTYQDIIEQQKLRRLYLASTAADVEWTFGFVGDEDFKKGEHETLIREMVTIETKLINSFEYDVAPRDLLTEFQKANAVEENALNVFVELVRQIVHEDIVRGTGQAKAEVVLSKLEADIKEGDFGGEEESLEGDEVVVENRSAFPQWVTFYTGAKRPTGRAPFFLEPMATHTVAIAPDLVRLIIADPDENNLPLYPKAPDYVTEDSSVYYRRGDNEDPIEVAYITDDAIVQDDPDIASETEEDREAVAKKTATTTTMSAKQLQVAARRATDLLVDTPGYLVNGYFEKDFPFALASSFQASAEKGAVTEALATIDAVLKKMRSRKQERETADICANASYKWVGLFERIARFYENGLIVDDPDEPGTVRAIRVLNKRGYLPDLVDVLLHVDSGHWETMSADPALLRSKLRAVDKRLVAEQTKGDIKLEIKATKPEAKKDVKEATKKEDTKDARPIASFAHESKQIADALRAVATDREEREDSFISRFEEVFRPPRSGAVPACVKTRNDDKKYLQEQLRRLWRQMTSVDPVLPNPRRESLLDSKKEKAEKEKSCPGWAANEELRDEAEKKAFNKKDAFGILLENVYRLRHVNSGDYARLERLWNGIQGHNERIKGDINKLHDRERDALVGEGIWQHKLDKNRRRMVDPVTQLPLWEKTSGGGLLGDVTDAGVGWLQEVALDPWLVYFEAHYQDLNRMIVDYQKQLQVSKGDTKAQYKIHDAFFEKLLPALRQRPANFLLVREKEAKKKADEAKAKADAKKNPDEKKKALTTTTKPPPKTEVKKATKKSGGAGEWVLPVPDGDYRFFDKFLALNALKQFETARPINSQRIREAVHDLIMNKLRVLYVEAFRTVLHGGGRNSSGRRRGGKDEEGDDDADDEDVEAYFARTPLKKGADREEFNRLVRKLLRLLDDTVSSKAFAADSPKAIANLLPFFAVKSARVIDVITERHDAATEAIFQCFKDAFGCYIVQVDRARRRRLAEELRDQRLYVPVEGQSFDPFDPPNDQCRVDGADEIEPLEETTTAARRGRKKRIVASDDEEEGKAEDDDEEEEDEEEAPKIARRPESKRSAALESGEEVKSTGKRDLTRAQGGSGHFGSGHFGSGHFGSRHFGSRHFGSRHFASSHRDRNEKRRQHSDHGGRGERRRSDDRHAGVGSDRSVARERRGGHRHRHRRHRSHPRPARNGANE